MATLASNTWVTVADAKEYLGLSGSANDDLITNLINRATTLVETYLNRTIKTTVYTNENYDGTGTNLLFLANYPITTFSQLQYRDSQITNDDNWTTVDAEDYFTYTNEGKIWKNTAFRDLPQHYRVTYTAGYASGSEPVDLTQAILDIISYLFNQKKARGIDSERLGEYSVTWSKQALKDSGAMDLLEPYRKVNIGGL